MKINIPFGAALTRLATLPPGAQRSLKDPYADKAAEQRRSTFLVIAILLVALGLSIWIRVDRDRRGYYFWEDPPTLGTSSPSDSS